MSEHTPASLLRKQKRDEREMRLPCMRLLAQPAGWAVSCGPACAPSEASTCRCRRDAVAASSASPARARGARRPGVAVVELGSRVMADGAQEFKEFEAAGWSRRADTYGRVSGAITARFVEPLLEAARVGAGMRVLDVATGPGHVAAAAAARGAVPVGVDIAEGMLAVARRDHPQLDIRAGDAEALPFADCAFDAVVGAFVLNHLPRPEVAAAELARVLASGGRLALSVWDVPERTRFIGLVRDAVARAGGAPSAEPPAGPDPFRFADDAQLRALLDNAGLEEVAVETVAVRHLV